MRSACSPDEQHGAAEEGVVNGIASYAFLQLLGVGDHGQVHRARPPARLADGGGDMAVKVFAASVPEEVFGRVVAELSVVAAVRSPYLVGLHEVGLQAQTCFYAMEYVSAGSLAAPAARTDRVAAMRAVSDAARGAHDLHEAGVAHRAIKPANILLSDRGGVLSDPGLAHFFAPGVTLTGSAAIHSLEYVDPVVLRGAEPSRASDIWSLGATLHLVMTGQGLFGQLPDGDAVGALRTVLTEAPAVSADLTPDESKVVRSCLQPDPAHRRRTAVDVAGRIDELVDAAAAEG